MTMLRVNCFSMSLDGYGAGPDQDVENPLGVGGEALQRWQFETRTFREMFGGNGGRTDVDDEMVRAGFDNVGAWIIGRNMFGPVRGPWQDHAWRGWWGETPPYHVPVFVLTHHAREPLAMDGGTTFHFVTGGIHEALERARAAAAGRDVRVGGGVSVIRQYLEARLLDELHLGVSPALLGRGEHLFAGLDLDALGYRVARHRMGTDAMHMILKRKND